MVIYPEKEASHEWTSAQEYQNFMTCDRKATLELGPDAILQLESIAIRQLPSPSGSWDVPVQLGGPSSTEREEWIKHNVPPFVKTKNWCFCGRTCPTGEMPTGPFPRTFISFSVKDYQTKLCSKLAPGLMLALPLFS